MPKSVPYLGRRLQLSLVKFYTHYLLFYSYFSCFIKVWDVHFIMASQKSW